MSMATSSAVATETWTFNVDDLFELFDPEALPANNGISLEVHPGEHQTR